MAHADKLSLTVVGVLFSNNKLHKVDPQGGIQTEAGRQGFAAFGAALAKQYKNQPVIWEVWNEPNTRGFWRKDGEHNSPEFAAEYTALVNTVAPAMIAADPDCFVVAGSISNYWDPSYRWTESCFKGGILNSGIKGWSVHPYGVKALKRLRLAIRSPAICLSSMATSTCLKVRPKSSFIHVHPSLNS